MSILTESQTPARPRKRAAVKPSGGKDGAKVKATLCLSAEASQRLSVHAAMVGEDRSTLVDQLIREHLRRFVVSDRVRPADPAMQESSAA
jgi:hypothetical protein